MKSLSKALTGTIAAGAMALASISPALAQDRGPGGPRGGNRGGGIDAGEIIAGALVIGGIAAIAASASKGDRDRNYGDYRYDRAGYRDGYGDQGGYYRGGGDNPREAIERCVRTAERDAGRYSHGRADVTDVRDVRETRWGYEVRGRIAVNSSGRSWRHGDSNYGRGWGGDYRGWDNSMRGYDSGSFKCKYERGRITELDYSGIRGL